VSVRPFKAVPRKPPRDSRSVYSTHTSAHVSIAARCRSTCLSRKDQLAELNLLKFAVTWSPMVHRPCNTANMHDSTGRYRRFPPSGMSAFTLPAIFAMLVAFASGSSAADPLRSTFASEVVAPHADIVLPLLTAVCGEGVRTVDERGHKAFGCGDSMDEDLASRHRQRRYPWTPHVSWEVDGIIFGHFLSPRSEDVALNCYACASHPYLYGGTLLLTKRSGQWQPVWFKQGVITRHCRRVSLATGRQILFCEETDGGMGHSVHGLYVVDFTKPKSAWDSVVLMADSYGTPMFEGVQTQFIDRVSFDETGQNGLLVRIYARHGRIPLSPIYEIKPLPKPKVSRYEIDFRLDGAAFKVTPETAAAARLFGTQ
jgi:hypothetical protein